MLWIICFWKGRGAWCLYCGKRTATVEVKWLLLLVDNWRAVRVRSIYSLIFQGILWERVVKQYLLRHFIMLDLGTGGTGTPVKFKVCRLFYRRFTHFWQVFLLFRDATHLKMVLLQYSFLNAFMLRRRRSRINYRRFLFDHLNLKGAEPSIKMSVQHIFTSTALNDSDWNRLGCSWRWIF